MFGFNLRRFIEGEEQAGKSREAALKMATRKLKGLLEEGHVRCEQVSIRELAEAFCGHRWVQLLNPISMTEDSDTARRQLEASDAVDVSAFTTIIGQIVYTKVHEGYEQEQFIGDRLVTVIPTKLQTEKIPGFEDVSDEAIEVREGMPYPYAGFGESFQVTPLTRKHGLAIALTKEAIFFDRTGIFTKHAMRIGERLAIRKEKEILDVVVGALNNYNWRGLTLNTYLPAPLTAGLWVNRQASNELLDWTDIDASKQLFQAIRNPDTQDPIIVGGMEILVPPGKEWTARRILNATEVRNDTTGGVVKMMGPSPIPSGMTIYSSQLLLDRIQAPANAAIGRVQIEADAAKANKYWWHGDFKKAFAWMENWPLTVVQAPPNSEPEFERDIVARWRGSERGRCAVWDPRYVVRNNDN